MSENLTAGQPSQRNVRRTIFKNTAAITLGNLALRGVNFIFSVYVVRRLGGDQYGQYSIVMGLVGLLTIIAELGVTQYVTREIARDRSKAEWMLGNLIVLRGLLAAVGIVVITAAALLLGYRQILVLGVFVQTVGFLISALEAPLVAVLAANERLDYTTALTVLGQVAVIVIALPLLWSGWGFMSLIVASHLSIVPRIVIAWWLIRRERLTTFSWRLRWRAWPTLIRSGLNFGMIQLAVTFGYSLDTVIMSRFQPENVIGWYALASRLISLPMYVVLGFKEALVPSLAWAYVHEPAEVDRWYYRVVKFVILSSLPLAVGCIAIAMPLFRLLYTPEFLPGAFLFQLLVCDVPGLMFMAFGGNMTTITGDEASAARIYTLNAVANLILNLYAIPRFGPIGAVVVTVVTDLASALQFHLLLRHKLHLPNMTSIVARVLLASLAMGAVVVLAGQQNLFLMVPLGALTYGGMVLALRLLDSAERALISRVFQRVKAFVPTRYQ